MKLKKVLCTLPVSYTHLDVYKRQPIDRIFGGRSSSVGGFFGVLVSSESAGVLLVLNKICLRTDTDQLPLSNPFGRDADSFRKLCQRGTSFQEQIILHLPQSLAANDGFRSVRSFQFPSCHAAAEPGEYIAEAVSYTHLDVYKRQ